MKILVTGSAGFIGFHLVKKLSERGDTVVGLDNINDYYDVSLKHSRLEETGINVDDIREGKPVQSNKYEKYTFYKLDLTDKERLLQLFREEGIDVVCNLAAQAGVRYSLINPQAYMESNMQGFLNLLECCRNFPVRHFTYASSSSVYGLNRKMPFSVHDNVDHPISLYAASKKSNELMAHTYSYLFNIPTTGLRFFTVYGPWGRPDMALFLFTKAIIDGKPIKVFNGGNMKRDFTYIDDIIEGVVRVIDNPPVDSATDEISAPAASAVPYRVFNIGKGSPVNLFDFIEEIEKNLGVEAIKELLPMQDGDVEATWANINDLTQILGYQPKTSVPVGVKAFVNWYKEFYNVKEPQYLSV